MSGAEGMDWIVGSVAVLGVAGTLAYFRAPLWAWTAVAAALLSLLTLIEPGRTVLLSTLWSIFIIVGLVLNVSPLRRQTISNHLFGIFAKALPPMSSTEREALEAGSVWWEGDMFAGQPRWKRLFAVPAPRLNAEEQAFLDGPVEELCRMLDDWDITHRRRDLPPEVWAYIKRHGFFGMIIPKRYGGLEFSAQGHSAVIMKLASRSVTAAVTVMVPNSLGPAELLLHYGTEAQKNHYLPRLARGEEIPCFALTSPEAGSDASGMPDRGIVCRADFEGRKDVLGVRVTWEKRYITLGPVATVLGLAFKLYDPERLLGGEVERGITLALIPTKTPGVIIGERHNPLDIPFQNGPNRGTDVFIPMDWLIGGADRIGQGWRMLMERLAVGRGISLPALSTGSGKLACRATGAYARIRKQFKVPIGRFEGVEELLARTAAQTYLMEGARLLTLGALDQGEEPAVVSAILKYQLTERMRRIVNDAMDIHGGSGICLGPRNVLGRAYQALPISITVEGANVLTRSLIIYGQGAVRCHPYLFKEMQAVADPDKNTGRKNFDRAFFGHVGFFISSFVRALWIGLTSARLVRAPIDGPARRYVQQLTRMSAAFAFLSEIALLSLGGALKRREKLSGRLADALSHLYLASAAIKHFEDQGRPSADVPLLAWACDDALHTIQRSLNGLLRNLPSRPLAWLARAVVFPWGLPYRTPGDALGHEVAQILLAPSVTRDRLTAGIFIPRDAHSPLSKIEDALMKVVLAEPHERKLDALRDAEGLTAAEALAAATARGVLSPDEAAKAEAARAARRAVIEVDAFPPDTFGARE